MSHASLMGKFVFSHMLMIDPLKQRRISHPNLAVARPGRAAQAPIDAVHQNMEPQQSFQNATPGFRGMSVSGVPATMTQQMPQQLPHTQPIPQQMPRMPQQMQQYMPQMMAQVPPVPMAAPLPHDDLAHLTRQLQGIDLGMPMSFPRRQSEPLPRHPRMGSLFDSRDLLDELDELEEGRFWPPEFRRDHRFSAPTLMAPTLMAPTPYYQQPRSVAPVVGQQMMPQALNPQMMLNPARPFSYATDQSPMAGMYPTINQDLQILSSVRQMRSMERIQQIIDVLVPRTPSEIEALRRHFRPMNSGMDMGVAFKSLLNASSEKPSVQYAFMGLVLGPALYDLWLMQHLERKNDDILIDILIGRSSDDIRYLLFKFQQQQQVQVSGRSISSTLETVTSNKILLSALNIATESTRPDNTHPIDQNLVHRDVDEIIKLMDATFASHTALFNILLRRSDLHLIQLNVLYRIKKDRALDEALRRNVSMDKMIRKIAVHAVRSATDPTYRDVMALRDAMGSEDLFGNGNEEKLAIRICRLHWYKQHWMQVKAGYMGHMGKQVLDKVNGQRGLLRDLLVAMCLV